MSIFVDAKARLIIHGITGTEGQKLAQKMLLFGTEIAAGVAPGRGGDWVCDGKVPVFDSTRSAVEFTGANTALITVPSRFAKDALMECASSGVSMVICTTENIPMKDMMLVKHFYKKHNVKLLGPSSPGIFSPEQVMIGSFPHQQLKKGRIGVVSRSGSLTYEVINCLAAQDIGISTCVGIGAAPIHGIGFIEILEAMQMDPQTDEIILIGKVDSLEEEQALRFAMRSILKPLVIYLYGYSRADNIDIKDIERVYPLAKTFEEIPNLLRTNQQKK
jgi:succinyl-CoA synthetase alpha subunit